VKNFYFKTLCFLTAIAAASCKQNTSNVTDSNADNDSSTESAFVNVQNGAAAPLFAYRIADITKNSRTENLFCVYGHGLNAQQWEKIYKLAKAESKQLYTLSQNKSSNFMGLNSVKTFYSTLAADNKSFYTPQAVFVSEIEAELIRRNQKKSTHFFMQLLNHFSNANEKKRVEMLVDTVFNQDFNSAVMEGEKGAEVRQTLVEAVKFAQANSGRSSGVSCPRMNAIMQKAPAGKMDSEFDYILARLLMRISN
jgi:hypothetical protein